MKNDLTLKENQVLETLNTLMPIDISPNELQIKLGLENETINAFNTIIAHLKKLGYLQITPISKNLYKIEKPFEMFSEFEMPIPSQVLTERRKIEIQFHSGKGIAKPTKIAKLPRFYEKAEFEELEQIIAEMDTTGTYKPRTYNQYLDYYNGLRNLNK